MTLTPAETRYPIITPISSRVTEERTACPTSNTTVITVPEPMADATTTARSPPKPSPAVRAAAPLPPTTRITAATPSEEPAEMPRMNGSARGLRNSVCMANPVTPSAAPARQAVMVRGSRTEPTISWAMGRVGCPVSTAQTSSRVIWAGPSTRPAATAAVSAQTRTANPHGCRIRRAAARRRCSPGRRTVRDGRPWRGHAAPGRGAPRPAPSSRSHPRR